MTKMINGNLNKNLVLSISCSIIVLNGSDGGDAVRVGAAMLQTQLGARHILLAGPKDHARVIRMNTSNDFARTSI